jgi:hypothetical protein
MIGLAVHGSEAGNLPGQPLSRDFSAAEIRRHELARLLRQILQDCSTFKNGERRATVRRQSVAMPNGIAQWALAVLVSVSLGRCLPAAASETVIPITPPGATDTDQAVIPPFPGVYGLLAVSPEGGARTQYDSTGRVVPSADALKLSSQVLAPGLAYVYPFHPFGGTVVSSFVQPVEALQFNIADGTFKDSQAGLQNAYSDLFFWTKHVSNIGSTPGRLPLSYGLSVGLGMALVIPDGYYDRHQPLSIGSNVWVPDPNAAFTYNTGPHLSFGDNTQISARAFYGIPLENPATHYTSGTVFDVDWSATEQFGLWRFGAAGQYQTQITADNPGNGIQLPDGNRYTEASIGPIIEYLVPGTIAFIKVKWLYTFYHRNYVDDQFLGIITGIKF